jgi:hypothetical protein
MIRHRVAQSTKAGLMSVLLLLAAVECFAAAAPMSIPQLALYQGADREKILIEGAKKEGAFMLYGSHTWYRTMVRGYHSCQTGISLGSPNRSPGRNSAAGCLADATQTPASVDSGRKQTLHSETSPLSC